MFDFLYDNVEIVMPIVFAIAIGTVLYMIFAVKKDMDLNKERWATYEKIKAKSEENMRLARDIIELKDESCKGKDRIIELTNDCCALKLELLQGEIKILKMENEKLQTVCNIYRSIGILMAMNANLDDIHLLSNLNESSFKFKSDTNKDLDGINLN